MISKQAVIDIIMKDLVEKGYGDPVARMVCNKIRALPPISMEKREEELNNG